ncbi:MAG: ABC transporter substrate-binding protein [Candidatus Aminicenantes bacterium]|nr:MAG: ABC transporter substrate-binding protein [Candidatus Aminicenantes bacterium]
MKFFKFCLIIIMSTSTVMQLSYADPVKKEPKKPKVTIAVVGPIKESDIYSSGLSLKRGIDIFLETNKNRLKEANVDIIFRNNNRDPGETASIAKELIKRAEVIGIVGCNSSTNTGKIAEIVKEHIESDKEKDYSLPIITSWSANSQLTSPVYPTVFQLRQNTKEALDMRIQAYSSHLDKYQTILVRQENDLYADGVEERLKSLFDKHGLKFRKSYKFQKSKDDFTSILKYIKDEKGHVPIIVMFAGTNTAQNKFLKQMEDDKEMHSIPFFHQESDICTLGCQLKKLTIYSMNFKISQKDEEKFFTWKAKLLKWIEKNKDLDYDKNRFRNWKNKKDLSFTYGFSIHDAWVYDSANMILTAVEKGNRTRSSIFEYLRSLKEFEGIIHTITLEDRRHSPIALTPFIYKYNSSNLMLIVFILITFIVIFIPFIILIKRRNINKKVPQKDFTPIPNKYVVGNPIATRDMFFGREEDFKQIKNWVEHDGPKVIFLKGGRRSGKTSILLQILNGRINGTAFPIFFDFHQIVPQIMEKQKLSFVLSQIILNHPEFNEFKKNTTNLYQLISSCSQKISPRKLVFLGDEFETLEDVFLSGDVESKEISDIRSILELPIFFIITGSKNFGDAFAPIFGPVAQIKEISLLSYGDSLALITKPVDKFLKYHGSSAKMIYRLSGGHPFYTQYICQTLISLINSSLRRNTVYHEDLLEVIDFIVQNPAGHIQETWRGMNPQEKAALAALANSIKDENTFAAHDKILKTIESNRFDISGTEYYEAISKLKKGTHLLLEWKKNLIRFKIDIMRHWISYYYQEGEDISND